jgi:hypothetical protein
MNRISHRRKLRRQEKKKKNERVADIAVGRHIPQAMAKGPSTWWLEGAGSTPQVRGSTPGLGLNKSHSPIPLKAHGKARS